MELHSGEVNDLIIEEVQIYRDERGHLFELFRTDNLAHSYGKLSHGQFWNQPQMAYASFTLPGISRGPHEHAEQTDVFVFADEESQFCFFAWDNRKDSTTFGNRQVVQAGGDTPVQIIVPPGIVHAYKNISSTRGLVLNSPDVLYAGWGRKDQVDEIRHEDDVNNPFRLDMQQYESDSQPSRAD